SRPDMNKSLKESGRTGTVGRGSQRFRDALVIAQMALSVVLLIGALLLLRSFVALERINLGFNPDSALTVRITLPPNTYSDDTNAIRMIRAIRQQIAGLPGVRAAGATRLLPLTGTIGNWSITQEGHVKRPGENPNGDWQVVTPGYFESMGIPLLRGRTFLDSDNENSPIVAVISETMAARYWPGEDAIGKRFRIGAPSPPWITVVGLVGHVRHSSLIERPRSEMYVPHAQWAAAGASTRLAMTFVIRTAGDPLAVLPLVRGAVRSLDPLLPVSEPRTLQQVAGHSLSQARFATTLLALFAGLALTLAALGIYGLIALLIVRRRREIGIRMALGARSREILLMVVGRGMMLVAVGVIVGLAGAGLLTRVLSSLLYGVRPFDPATYVAVPAILATVAVLACAIPARRAAHFDPITALRQE
ncbi:MAG TPA: FtsX-like permease family protein, partial [Vicinamibacterales bacterium]